MGFPSPDPAGFLDHGEVGGSGGERERRRRSRQARLLWHLVEPVHAVTYFAPQARAAAEALGLRGFWAGYVVLRSAPLGVVPPAVVTAAFHGFAPRRVEKVLPAAWDVVAPAAALDARASSAAAALRQVCGQAGVDEAHLVRAADALGAAAAAADVAGRVLAAANAALPPRHDPVERLWQATTVLREHRGDGHVAALVTAGVSPVESHLLKVAAGESPEEQLRLGRAWTEEQWADGARRLVARGWTARAADGSVVLTDAGRAARDDVELGPTWRRPIPGPRWAPRRPTRCPPCSARSPRRWPAPAWSRSRTPSGWAGRPRARERGKRATVRSRAAA